MQPTGRVTRLKREGRPRQESAPAHEPTDRADTTAAPGTREEQRLAWYRWYPGDFFAETQGLSWDACAAYRALLDGQWNMGTLPGDLNRLRTVLHPVPPASRWRAAWAAVSRFFPVIEGGGRQNPRLAAMREADLALRRRQRLASQRANAARWHRFGSESDSESESERQSIRIGLHSDSDSDTDV